MITETWHVTYAVFSPRNVQSEGFTLKAQGIPQAKSKLLKEVQKRARRLKNWKGKFLYVSAVPKIPGKDMFNSNRMLRLKVKYCRQEILNQQKPRPVFVRGYGSEAQKKIFAP